MPLAGRGFKAPPKTPWVPEGPVSLEPDEVLIEVYDNRRDRWGRVHYFTFWFDEWMPGGKERVPEGTPPIRGQVFIADEREDAARWTARGFRVTITENLKPDA